MSYFEAGRREKIRSILKVCEEFSSESDTPKEPPKKKTEIAIK